MIKFVMGMSGIMIAVFGDLILTGRALDLDNNPFASDTTIGSTGLGILIILWGVGCFAYGIYGLIKNIIKKPIEKKNTGEN